jgi:hypothetical protein
MSYTNGLDKPTDYFNTVLYTGNGGSQNITGVGFSPNWVWLKGRNNANNHNLNDTVRGVNKQLYSDLTNAETTATTHLTAFDSDGFTLGNDGAVNGSSDTYVSWNWKASGSTASNTDGSITSTVSANTTAGFSIVSYTGSGATSTIGHGLGSAPKWVIVKQRDNTRNWVAMHEGIGFTKYLYLDSNQASNTGNFFNNTDPSSTVFNVVNDSGVNGSGGSYIAYCFAPKKSYSKFGSYTGNGSTDGTFVYLGFRPAWVMIKRTDGTNSWVIYDNKREGYNVDNDALQANGSNTEGTSDDIDLLSNGFKMRTSGVGENGSGNSYIYMAFAENPFVTSTGIPTTAR